MDLQNYPAGPGCLPPPSLTQASFVSLMVTHLMSFDRFKISELNNASNMVDITKAALVQPNIYHNNKALHVQNQPNMRHQEIACTKLKTLFYLQA